MNESQIKEKKGIVFHIHQAYKHFIGQDFLSDGQDVWGQELGPCLWAGKEPSPF